MGESLARAVGALPLVVDAERQDYLVGTLSHLPYLLACSLVSTADATTSSDPLVWQILASGFRDTSRVAGSDVTMMLDILLTNREEIAKAARFCVGRLEHLIRLVEEGDEEHLRSELCHIRQTRKEMYPSGSVTVHGIADGDSTTLRGEVPVPGDKSISHRALMLAALAEGSSRIDGLLLSGDCEATFTCLRDLGVTIETVGNGASASVVVHGRGLRGLQPPQKPLDCSRSGTTMRLLAGILAGQSFDSVLTGEAQLLRRPCGGSRTPCEDGSGDLRHGRAWSAEHPGPRLLAVLPMTSRSRARR